MFFPLPNDRKRNSQKVDQPTTLIFSFEGYQCNVRENLQMPLMIVLEFKVKDKKTGTSTHQIHQLENWQSVGSSNLYFELKSDEYILNFPV